LFPQFQLQVDFERFTGLKDKPRPKNRAKSGMMDLNLKWPGGRAEREKNPSELVVVICRIPVSTLQMTTVTPGITASLGSATVPEMIPPGLAQPERHASSKTGINRPAALARRNFGGPDRLFIYSMFSSSGYCNLLATKMPRHDLISICL